MRIQIDRTAAESLRSQLIRQLKQAAVEAPAGSRLPSSRALARRLKVSRNTVLEAYEALSSDGVVTTRRGSGTLVGVAPRVTRRLSAHRLLREAQYSGDPVPLRDLEGNPLYLIA